MLTPFDNANNKLCYALHDNLNYILILQSMLQIGCQQFNVYIELNCSSKDAETSQALVSNCKTTCPTL